MKDNIFEQLFFFRTRKLFSYPSAEEIFVMYSHLVFFLKEFFAQKRIFLIDSSAEGFHPVYRDYVFLVIDIFSKRNHFLVFLQQEFSNVLECRCYFEDLFAEENFSDFTEEFYPVYENGIYNYSFSLYPSAEGIFLYLKMRSFDMDIYFTMTLIFQNKNLFFIG